MRRSFFLISLALVGLVLSACKIVVTPIPPPQVDATVTATDPGTKPPALWSGSVSGDGVLIRVNVPASVQNGYDLLYVELDSDVDLEVRGPSYANVIARSENRSYFAQGLSALSAEGTEVSGQAIDLLVPCRGSCVILPANQAGTLFVHVEGGGTVSLYAYGDFSQDTTEPDNSAINSAPAFDPTAAAGEQGAIETLGDVDYWRVTASGITSMLTAAGDPVGLRIEIVDPTGARVAGGGPFAPGTSFQVFANDYLRIYSSQGRAGASATSQYTLVRP